MHSYVFLTFAKDSQEIRQIDCEVIVSFVRNSQAFVTICKAPLVSAILLANRIIFGEFDANIKFLHSQIYSPLCERSITENRLKLGAKHST